MKIWFYITNKKGRVMIHTKESKMTDTKGLLVCLRTNSITHTHTHPHTSSEVLTAGCCHVLVFYVPSSRVQRELVLFYGFFHPGAQPRFVKGLDERLLGRVVLHRCLLGFVVRAGLGHFDSQSWQKLKIKKKILHYFVMQYVNYNS